MFLATKTGVLPGGIAQWSMTTVHHPSHAFRIRNRSGASRARLHPPSCAGVPLSIHKRGRGHICTFSKMIPKKRMIFKCELCNVSQLISIVK